METPVQVLCCEFCEILKEVNFINVYELLLLKSKTFIRASFRKASDFYYKQNRQLLYSEGTGWYVFLKITELLYGIIFQDTFK